jgi:hypothetical protein
MGAMIAALAWRLTEKKWRRTQEAP